MSDAAMLAECTTVRGHRPLYIWFGKVGIFWGARIHFESGQTYDDPIVNTMVKELDALVRTVGRHVGSTPEYVKDNLTGELKLTLLVKSSDTSKLREEIQHRLLEVVQARYTEVLSVSLEVQRNGDGTIKSLKFLTYNSENLAPMMDLHDDWGTITRGRLSLALNLNTGSGSSTSIDVYPRFSTTEFEEVCHTLQAATHTFIHINHITGQ